MLARLMAGGRVSIAVGLTAMIIAISLAITGILYAWQVRRLLATTPRRATPART